MDFKRYRPEEIILKEDDRFNELIDSGHHHHHHHHHNCNNGNKLLITMVLNYLISIFQIIGGIFSNSISLISDSLHNLGDATALLIAWIAEKIGKKDSNERQTFGFKRIEILAALFNSVVLIAICLFLFYKAWLRFIQPEEVEGNTMLIVAIIGFVANLISVIILKDRKDHNINIKAAYLHLLGDTLSSVAVIGGAICMLIWKIYWIDPVLTILIGLYILWHTFDVLKHTVEILMQSTPRGINIIKIQEKVESISEVANIHHVHLWNLTENLIHFECHVDLSEDLVISKVCLIRKKIEKILHEDFNINHVTIQFELDSCDNKKIIHHGKI
jgi:cobalt-zinc-cadmium efflux system protein